MKILVIGGGGREHALAWKLARSARVDEVLIAPGNAGMTFDAKLAIHPANDVAAWLALAQEAQVAFTVVGPEVALAAGVVDAFRAAGLAIFGPSQAAARLESSKSFAKDFMARHGIPTARYAHFTDSAAAHAYVDVQGAPIVVKADGLAAGKGVVVAQSVAEAHEAIDQWLVNPGDALVIEECWVGEEASFMVMVDGEHILALPTSQDHKRLLDGDKGPNTGGMGAVSPAPVLSDALCQRVLAEVIEPAVRGMAAEGTPFSGFLYAGLMIRADGEYIVLEFNTRLGDPEAQAVLARLKSELVELFEQALAGQLDQARPEWDPRAAVAIVLAAEGYPGRVKTGDPIENVPDNISDMITFHSGTAFNAKGQLVTGSGRVISAVGLGGSIKHARHRAYMLADLIEFPGKRRRKDIANRAVEHEKAAGA